MNMAAKFPNQLSLLMLHCVGVVLSASYYQRDYSGYLFTIPGFSDAERRSQVDAQKWCNQNGSKLLAITNQSIQSAAVAFINEAVGQGKMTTGNPIITDGKRSGGDWTWINETAMTPLLMGGQEGGLNNSHVYLYLQSPPGVSNLIADPPNYKNYFICEGQTFCGIGHRYQNQCYQSFREDNQLLSWFEARNLCLQRGGDLATFELIKANNYLNMLNGSWLIPSSHYWIGLRRQWWTWMSINSDVTYSQWSDGRPFYDGNHQCLCLLPNIPVNDWKWSECDCTQRFQFVCISPAPLTSSVGTLQSSSWQSTTTLTSIPIESTSFKSASADINGTFVRSAVNLPLAVGLGVGLGGGIMLIVLIVVIVVFLLSRKGHLNFRRKPPAQPDVTLAPSSSNAIYAEIAKIPENSTSTPQESIADSSENPTEYATIEIVRDRSKLIANYGNAARHNASHNSNSEL